MARSRGEKREGEAGRRKREKCRGSAQRVAEDRWMKRSRMCYVEAKMVLINSKVP